MGLELLIDTEIIWVLYFASELLRVEYLLGVALKLVVVVMEIA